MAAGGPTRPLLQKIRVIDVSDENGAGYFLLLEMAFQTKRSVALVQQALVNGTVRRMTNGASLPQRLVLIHKRAALLRVTLETRFVSAQERKAAGFELLLNVRLSAFDRDAFVYLMTIRAAHFAFRHRVMMRQCERCANFQVTLKTCFRRLPWIDDRTRPAPGFDVQTPRPVARLAAHVRDLLWSSAALCLSAFSTALTYDYLFCLQSRVGGCSEIAHDLFVARCAFLRTHELRARDTGRSENRSAGGATGKQNHSQRDGSSRTP
jgi:hypothetical protein